MGRFAALVVALGLVPWWAGSAQAAPAGPIKAQGAATTATPPGPAASAPVPKAPIPAALLKGLVRPGVPRLRNASLADLEAAARRPLVAIATWQALGMAYTRQAIRTFDPTYYALSTKAFAQADKLVKDDYLTLVGRGVLLLSLHRFEAARAVGLRAHQQNPDSADPLTVLVDANVELGNYEEAAQRLQAVLDRKPNLSALSRVSYLRELHGDTAGAVEAMQQAEAAGAGQSFDVATIVALEGDLAFNHGDVPSAERFYARALAMAPDLLSASVGRARVIAAQGHPDDAVALLRKITGRIPQTSALILLGELQQLQGQSKAADQTFELVRAEEQLQRASGAVTDLEMALFEADHGTATKARRLAEEAYRARRTIYTADALAWATFKDGDVNAAVAFTRESLRLGTADPLLHFHAAMILHAARLDVDAKTELSRVVTTNPWFSLHHRAEAAGLAKKLGVAFPAGPKEAATSSTP